MPIAHVGHWAIWVLYAVPVLIVLASILYTVWRDRRGDGGAEPPPER